MPLDRCRMCGTGIEDRLVGNGLCPTCHEEIEAEMHDLWLRDPSAAGIRQRVCPRHDDDDDDDDDDAR